MKSECSNFHKTADLKFGYWKWFAYCCGKLMDVEKKNNVAVRNLRGKLVTNNIKVKTVKM